MRKTAVVFLALFFLYKAAPAQKSTTALVAAGAYSIQPSGEDEVLKKLPFSGIRVIDARFDTSKVGYISIRKNGSYKKLVAEAGLQQGMQAYLQKKYSAAFSSSSAYSLVLVVKHLWLQGTSDAEQEHYKIEQSSVATSTFSICTASCEAYVFTGETYVPLFRRDSSYKEKGALKKCAGLLLLQPFEDCLTKAAGKDFSKIASVKRKLSWEEITAYNAERLHYPLFSTRAFEKGIYKTYNDFLQNNPSKQEFVIESGAYSDEVFVSENGKQVSLSDYWGVYDGKTFYVHIGYRLFEMVRQNNSFDILGSTLYIQKYIRNTVPVSPTPAGVLLAIATAAATNKNRAATYAKPLQLNMETGKPY